MISGIGWYPVIRVEWNRNRGCDTLKKTGRKNVMDKILDPENAFFSAVSRIVDMFLLSILWVLTSLPVITAGAASTGLYYAVVKSVRSQRSYPAREFFRGFRDNFCRATVIWTGILLIGVMFFLSDFPMMLSFLNDGEAVDILFLGLFVGKAFLFLGVACLCFTLLSRFEGSTVRILENAVWMILRRPVRTLCSILILIFCLLFAFAEPLFLVWIPASFMWLLSFLLEPVFCREAERIEGRTEKQAVQETEAEERDQWYLENGDSRGRFITVIRSDKSGKKRKQENG